MRALFRIKELLALLKDFYQLTGLRTVVFDENGNDILSYPEEHPNFCKLIRSSKQGLADCLLCDKKACNNAKTKGESVIYTCHAGLSEVISPIYVDKVVVGYLLLSHIVETTTVETQIIFLIKIAEKYNIEKDMLIKAFNDLQVSDYKTIKSASNLLFIAATAMCETKLAQMVNNDVESELMQYIDNNIHTDLSSNELCSKLGIGRTSLYHISKKLFGCGIKKHISRLRIQKAMHLLTHTNLTNAQICDRVGINDYNYFFRVFQKHTASTPSEYRKLYS